jgi:hypothetical protein
LITILKDEFEIKKSILMTQNENENKKIENIEPIFLTTSNSKYKKT